MIVAPPRLRCQSARPTPRAFTLLEILTSLVITSILAAALMSTMIIATRTLDISRSPAALEDRTIAALDRLSADLRLALELTELTRTRIELTVPDRSDPPDGTPETIVYAWSGSPGAPLTRECNGASVTILDSVSDLDLISLSGSIPPQDTTPVANPDSWGYFGSDSHDLGLSVLLVVADTAFPSTAATARKDLLESWGCTVILIDDDDGKDGLEAALPGTDVVVLTEEIAKVDAAKTLRSAAIGVVNEHWESCNKLGLSDSMTILNAAEVNVTDNLHAITLGMSVGTTSVTTSLQPFLETSSPAPGLRELAQNHGTSLGVLESGAAKYGGGVATHRRAQLAWGGPGFDIESLNVSGRSILRRAVLWASGGVPTWSTGYEKEFKDQLGGIKRTHLATQVWLPQAGVASSITAFVGGNDKLVRLAIYDDLGGEPDSLLAESAAVRMSKNDGWLTLSLPPTPLTAGECWLAISFEDDGQYIFHDAGKDTSQTRLWASDGIGGFESIWGTSDQAFLFPLSIHVNYVDAE